MDASAEMSDYSSGEDRYPKRRKMSPPRKLPAGGGQKDAGQAALAGNSFAAKMMAKMGYVQGQGLGVDGRGRLAPIESQLRPQGAGLGAVKEKTKQAKEEEKREAAFRGEEIQDSSEEERDRRRKRKGKTGQQASQSDGPQVTIAPAKPKYRTLAELERAADGLKVPDALKSIIDATGAETKILNSTAGLMSQTKYIPSETEAVKIAKRAERDLLSFSDEWVALRQRGEFYDVEGVHLSESIEREDKVLEETSGISDLIQQLNDVSMTEYTWSQSTRAWDEVTSKLQPLRIVLADSGELSLCYQTSVAAIAPLFKDTMSDWEPLEDPAGVAAYIRTLRDLLGVEPLPSENAIAKADELGNSKPQPRSTTAYESMIHKWWVPPVRAAIMRWNVQDPSSLIAIIDAWKDLLPAFVLAHVVDRLVAQRLTDAIAAWSPRKSRRHKSYDLPLHIWLFPWLEYLDDQHIEQTNPSGLMAEIKRKFKEILKSWNLAQGLVPGLNEWKSILGPELASLLQRYLLPRFRPHLAGFEINPADQQMELLDDTLQWSAFFSEQVMAELMRSEFFPKWHNSLYNWLTTPGVNYNEVGEWFQWWKSVFHDKVSANFNNLPSMSKEWERGLQLMLRASESGPEAAASLPAPGSIRSPPKQTNLKQEKPNKELFSDPKPVSTADTVTTFKDVVEEWCAENDLYVRALREADVQSGLPLFRITASATGKGGVVVYFKGDVIWVRRAGQTGIEGNTFVPMGLDDGLARLAEGK